MKTIRVYVELKLENESKTPESIAQEVYTVLSENYVFDVVEEECVVVPVYEHGVN